MPPGNYIYIHEELVIHGQVDSPELLEMLEIIEITGNFTDVTKYLTKLKETLINYVWEKFHFKKL